MLLNVEEDHLDRHGDLERYREAKLRVFANQRPATGVRRWLPGGRCGRIGFGAATPTSGWRLRCAASR